MIYAHIYIFKKFFMFCWPFWLFFFADDEWPTKKYDVESIRIALWDLRKY